MFWRKAAKLDPVPAEDAFLCGELEPWPPKLGLARLLEAGGLSVYVGRYSVRVNDASHFVFEEYGGDLGDPVIDADADDLASMLRDATPISRILASAKIRHRFEIYVGDSDVLAYLHYNWPREPTAAAQHDDED